MHEKLNHFFTAVNDITNTIPVESLHTFVGLSFVSYGSNRIHQIYRDCKMMDHMIIGCSL